jgi:hypothetical protein
MFDLAAVDQPFGLAYVYEKVLAHCTNQEVLKTAVIVE